MLNTIFAILGLIAKKWDTWAESIKKRRRRGHESGVKKDIAGEPDKRRKSVFEKFAELADLYQETAVQSGRSFKEYDSTYELIFMYLPPGDICHLLPGGKIRTRIEKFLDYCMPGDLDYRITLKVDSSTVGRETEKYLGYSSYL